MATYGQAYYQTLRMINQQYIGLSNLNSLKHIENKIKCYKDFNSQPHEYYECFINVEREREGQSKQLMNNYTTVEDDFKLCKEGCKNQNKIKQNTCANKCNENFTNSIKVLYDSFYKNRVGQRKQYKKIQK